MRYREISRKWFALRLPKGMSLEEYEGESGTEDRIKTRELLEKMAKNVIYTAKELFGVPQLEPVAENLKIIDQYVNSEVANDWIRHSDPGNLNNEFVRNVSEIAVHLGQTVIFELGGEWRYARAPNYFESVVIAEGCELYVFDIMMKKCSDDFGSESIFKKFESFSQAVVRFKHKN